MGAPWIYSIYYIHSTRILSPISTMVYLAILPYGLNVVLKNIYIFLKLIYFGCAGS